MKFTLKYKVPFVVAGVSIMTAMTNLPSAPQAKPFEIEKDNAFEKTDSATRQDAKAENTIEFTPIVPTHATAQRYNVVYYLSNGDEVVRSGGTRAWRNNNPGCIRPGSIADAYGAIGSAGGFAVFPDEQTGIDAITGLLLSDKYCNKTIGSALYSYAPPFENNTVAYQQYVRRLTGLSVDMRIRDLTPEQLQKLVDAIRKVEGWRVGTEMNIVRDTVQNHISSQIQHTV